MAAVLEAPRPTVITEAPEGSQPADDTSPAQRLFTRDEFLRLAQTGILKPGEHVELVNGRILTMAPQGDGHASSTVGAADILRAVFADGYHVREEKPLVISDILELEPDVVVVRGSVRDNPRHPTPDRVALVLEISDSSVNYDLGTKAVLYARAGIPYYWVMNLPKRQLVVHRSPGEIGNGAIGYRTVHICTLDSSVSPLALPDASINVGALFIELPETVQPDQT